MHCDREKRNELREKFAVSKTAFYRLSKQINVVERNCAIFQSAYTGILNETERLSV